MTVVHAAILGLVQGLTEFLPISSSGHLVLVPAVLGWPEPPLSFLVLLHAGSLLAVVTYFWRELVQLLFGLFRPGAPRRLVVLLALATLPGALIGLPLKDVIEQQFGREELVALLLMGTGVILFAADLIERRRPPRGDDEGAGVEELAEAVTPGRALAIGLAQSVALLPGISRSGSTIATGLGSGVSRVRAARFSFLMAIPAIAGSLAFEVPDLASGRVGGAQMAVGLVVSTITSYAAIGGLIAYLHRRGLRPFAIYCLVAGAMVFIALTA
ncbi:MAG: undecaprenyl-diphosphate phosphatase [Actinomycetota bacterium]